MSKVDSIAMKSGYFNFPGTSNVEYSMTSGFFVNGNKSVRTVNDDNSDVSQNGFEDVNEVRKKRIVRKSSRMPSSVSKKTKRKKTSGFKRYDTCAPKLKKMNLGGSQRGISSDSSYESQDEDVSDCDHDNPAGVLIELYK